MQILQPPDWARPRGYSNGIAARGTLVSIAGQIGWDAQCRFADGGFVGQCRLAIANILEVLAQAGGRPEHIVRMTWYLGSKEEYWDKQKELGAVFRRLIGHYNAAMTAVQVAGFVEHGAKVEIEATAVIPD